MGWTFLQNYCFNCQNFHSLASSVNNEAVLSYDWKKYLTFFLLFDDVFSILPFLFTKISFNQKSLRRGKIMAQ